MIIRPSIYNTKRPDCDKPYHIHNGFQQIWVEIKSLWKHALWASYEIASRTVERYLITGNVFFTEMFERCCWISTPMLKCSLLSSTGVFCNFKDFCSVSLIKYLWYVTSNYTESYQYGIFAEGFQTSKTWAIIIQLCSYWKTLNETETMILHFYHLCR